MRKYLRKSNVKPQESLDKSASPRPHARPSEIWPLAYNPDQSMMLSDSDSQGRQPSNAFHIHDEERAESKRIGSKAGESICDSLH